MIENYIPGFHLIFRGFENEMPWEITKKLAGILEQLISGLDANFILKDGIAIHKTATIETGVVLKAPVIIGENCFVGAHAYFRGGVYLGKSVSIGPSCEIKSSIIFSGSSVAHFNFIGDSIIGKNVNFEAGSITANHYNERENKRIFVRYKSEIVNTGIEKFGSLVGNNSKIGANAVLSPGTLLEMNSVIKRLELVEQITEKT